MLEDQPLALCDSRSVGENDLVPTDRLVPDRVGEVYYLKFNPKHRWFVSRPYFETVDLKFWTGIGFRHKRGRSLMRLSCMTLKPALMPDVSKPSSIKHV